MRRAELARTHVFLRFYSCRFVTFWHSTVLQNVPFYVAFCHILRGKMCPFAVQYAAS